MQRAASGTYRNGQVFFDDPPPALNESKVIVVFLEESAAKPRLTNIFSLFGAWEDTRSVDEIIYETRNSRVSATASSSSALATNTALTLPRAE